MGGVGCEPLLFGVVCFEPGEHRVEGVGEFAELVVAALHLDPVGQRSVRGQACGVGDASQRGEHAAGEDPPSHETEHQQERQRRGRLRDEGSLEVGAVGPGHRAGDHVGYVAQQEHPHDREQQGTCKHQKPGVAEREFEANAQTWRPIHVRPPHLGRLVRCRCGIRRRPRWR